LCWPKVNTAIRGGGGEAGAFFNFDICLRKVGEVIDCTQKWEEKQKAATISH
jgi:hypothetical protein